MAVTRASIAHDQGHLIPCGISFGDVDSTLAEGHVLGVHQTREPSATVLNDGSSESRIT